MQPKATPKNTRTCKSTSKSGCRTCKLRKVKCDEGFPACSRCQATGRVCEGYGIWGGGGENASGERGHPTGSKIEAPHSTTTRDVQPAASLSLLFTSAEEREHLDWFKHRTATKLPGSFRSGFWTTLLFQASFSEPAVLHAIIALSSVQRRGMLQKEGEDERWAAPDKEEQFTLQHYVKAIRNLHPHFQAQDRASFRVALISCIVFVSLDFLRGHFTTGQVHLLNGLRLLEGARMISASTSEPPCLWPGRESVDEWIIEALSRLHIQVQLFRQPHQKPCFLLSPLYPNAPVRSFRSLKEAWRELDRLLNITFHLNEQARAGTLMQHLYKQHHIVETDLTQWLESYEILMDSLPGHRSLEEQKAYRLIYVHHTMATIMAAVCLYPYDEEVFDAHTNLFIRLLSQLDDIWALGAEVSVSPPGHLIHMAGSIIDMGCLAPLYYTAIKCRVHQVRLKAIHQLESTFHREGIWDAKITARVARKIMEIEERDFYDVSYVADDAMAGGSLPIMVPDAQEHSMPPLPRSYRLHDAEMVLSGDPTEKVLLHCSVRQDDADYRVLVAEYHLALQLWLGPGEPLPNS